MNISMTSTGMTSDREPGADAVVAAFSEFVAAAEATVVGVDVRRMLLPGRPEAEIRARFAEHSLDASDELVAYWTLQDGMSGADGVWRIAQWGPVSLDRALSEWAIRTSGWSQGAGYEWQDPGWFELETDHPLVAQLGVPDGNATPVRRIDSELFDLNEETNEHQLASIATLFDVMAVAISEGLIVPAPRRHWSWGEDAKRWHEFHRGVGLF